MPRLWPGRVASPGRPAAAKSSSSARPALSTMQKGRMSAAASSGSSATGLVKPSGCGAAL
ncbi:MAG: hypothetical protein IPL03_13650 [Sterolibacteriaceae bacterium]|nr:hypothetical protein [Candidatus Methylophosphatis haderslevensis]